MFSDEFTAVDLILSLKRKKMRVSDLIESSLKKIADREPSLKIWAYLDDRQILEQAQQIDQILESCGSRDLDIFSEMPLLGVPIGIKDICDTKDMPTEYGSPLFEGRQPVQDSTVVAILRKCGTIVMGKTHTNEFAAFTPCETRNPHNPEHTPGGSSSGSAAAVADGQVPVSIGTQTAGSIIRPASYCGVLGYKPTFALISRAGILDQSRRLDTVGIFSRSLADMAIVADELMRFDPADVDMKLFGPMRLHEALGTELPRPPKFIFFEPPQWRDASSVVRQKFMEVIKSLEENCDVNTGPAGFYVANQMQRMIQYTDIATNYGEFYDEAPGEIAPEIIEIIRNGRMNSAVDYVRAVNQREPIYATVKSYLSQYDAIVWPAAGDTAPVGYSTGATPDFCAPWTYLGMPVINVPALDIEGMPFGIQLIGLRGGDRNLFRAVKWFQDKINELDASVVTG